MLAISSLVRNASKVCSAALLMSLSMLQANAADMCTGTAQVLVPDANGNATCVAGYDGAAHSNCNAVHDSVTIDVAYGGLTCLPGPSCPSGYAMDLPPPIGSPANMSQAKSGICEAVCSPVFVKHGWPCSCPYGQSLDATTHQCVATCGSTAIWQHSSDFEKHPWSPDSYAVDAGVCTCPAGKEYDAAYSACMTPCPEGKTHSGDTCVAVVTGVPKTNYCANGQSIYSCTCGSGHVVVDKKCMACTVNDPNPACQVPQQTGGDDEIHPVGPLPAKMCSAGSHSNGVACVSNTPAAQTCPAKMHWDGLKCVRTVVRIPGVVPTQPTCPIRTHWDGRSCIND